MDKNTLAGYLDLANHHQDVTDNDIKHLCEDVLKWGFNGAFINPCYVALAKSHLLGRAKVGTVVSFPLGQETLEIKLQTAARAIRDGADELDVSLNIAHFKSGQWERAEEEAKEIVSLVKSQKEVLVKFIIETGCLDQEEIKKASRLVADSGADFVKTSSGWGPRGASLEDIDLIKGVVGDKVKIKAAGGVDTYQEAVAFIEKGVARIGTSHAVAIIEGSKGV